MLRKNGWGQQNLRLKVYSERLPPPNMCLTTTYPSPFSHGANYMVAFHKIAYEATMDCPKLYDEGMVWENIMTTTDELERLHGGYGHRNRYKEGDIFPEFACP